MLKSVKEITGYVLNAQDGEIGRCKDFLFDDEIWTIRYMVADTGKWLPGKKVLISPISLGETDWGLKLIQVYLDKQRIEDAPLLDEHAPVSRQYEIKYHEYFGWPSYWVGVEAWGIHGYPGPLAAEKKKEFVEDIKKSNDPQLRSVKEVTGYHIQAKDDDMGHVKDFIVNDKSWTISYVVVDTRNWYPGGRKVLISPAWIESIDWPRRRMMVDLSAKQIKESPEYDPHAPVNREYETRLYDFYGRPKYW
jgi:hypothetical protein